MKLHPFKILGLALAAGIAFGSRAQIAVVPQAIAEIRVVEGYYDLDTGKVEWNAK
jgi:hypothetical protein